MKVSLRVSGDGSSETSRSRIAASLIQSLEPGPTDASGPLDWKYQGAVDHSFAFWAPQLLQLSE